MTRFIFNLSHLCSISVFFITLSRAPRLLQSILHQCQHLPYASTGFLFLLFIHFRSFRNIIRLFFKPSGRSFQRLGEPSHFPLHLSQQFLRVALFCCQQNFLRGHVGVIHIKRLGPCNITGGLDIMRCNSPRWGDDGDWVLSYTCLGLVVEDVRSWTGGGFVCLFG